MKTRIAFALCLGVCSLSVLLPLGIFYIQDSVAVDKDIVWQSSTEDIAKTIRLSPEYMPISIRVMKP